MPLVYLPVRQFCWSRFENAAPRAAAAAPPLCRNGRDGTMKHRAFTKPVRRLVAALILAAATFGLANGSESRERVDRTLLPPHPVYQRNRACSSINAHIQYASVPLSQGEAAMCFAYSTAAMISQRVGFAVSPLDIATTFYLTDARRLAESPESGCEAASQRRQEVDPEVLILTQSAHDTSEDGTSGNHPFIDKLEGGEEDAAALLANLQPLCPERRLALL